MGDADDGDRDELADADADRDADAVMTTMMPRKWTSLWC